MSLAASLSSRQGLEIRTTGSGTPRTRSVRAPMRPATGWQTHGPDLALARSGPSHLHAYLGVAPLGAHALNQVLAQCTSPSTVVDSEMKLTVVFPSQVKDP